MPCAGGTGSVPFLVPDCERIKPTPNLWGLDREGPLVSESGKEAISR